MAHPSSRSVECTIPVLPVRNLAKSAGFYTQQLRFQLDWGDTQRGMICSVSRDGCHIMLMQQSAEFTPGWVWIGLEDDSLFEEFRSQGVRVLQEPKNFSLAWEMKIQDPDGNVLWLGTESRADLPLEDADG